MNMKLLGFNIKYYFKLTHIKLIFTSMQESAAFTVRHTVCFVGKVKYLVE